MAGIVTSPYALQNFGRKTTNLVASLPALAGWILMMVAQNPEQLLGSRVLQVSFYLTLYMDRVYGKEAFHSHLNQQRAPAVV